MRKGLIFLKAIGLVLVLMLGLFCFRWFFFNVIKRNQIIDGLVNFRQTVIEDLEHGETSKKYYVKNVNISDVHTINTYIDSAYGRVDTYKILMNSGDYLAIDLSIELSENYYVMRKLLYDEDIPGDMVRANELYNKIVYIVDKVIDDKMSDFDKEIAIHDYIIKNCEYGYPDNKDDGFTAYGVLVSGKSMCDGYTEAFYMIMTSLGIETDIIVGDTDQGLHAWNLIKLGGDWYHVDLTWDDSLPDMGDYVKHTYVNLTDETIGLSHMWESVFYNKCYQSTFNYYNKKFAMYDDFESAKRGLTLQLNNSRTLEVAVKGDVKDPNLSFLYNDNAIRSIKYVVEDMGEYTIMIVYLNQ